MNVYNKPLAEQPKFFRAEKREDWNLFRQILTITAVGSSREDFYSEMIFPGETLDSDIFPFTPTKVTVRTQTFRAYYPGGVWTEENPFEVVYS